MRAGRVVAIAGISGLLAVLGLLGIGWWVVAPPPPAPDLAGRSPPQPEPVITYTAPQVIPEVLERCPLTIWVSSSGEALAGAEVHGAVTTAAGERYPFPRGRTDDDGLRSIPEAPCGELVLRVSAEGYVPHGYTIGDTRDRGRVEVELLPGVLLDGRISAADGSPLEGVMVRFGGDATLSDGSGAYAMWVSPGASGTAEATLDGYLSDRRDLYMPADGGVTLDFVLSAVHRVRVYCAGLPGNSCADIHPGVMCTHPALVVGAICYGDPMSCRCPEGVAAVRGGGELTRVEADQDVAWLDFRYDGGVSGRALIDGEPAADCTIELVRVPRMLLGDLPRGILTARNGYCEEDGSFSVEGLRPGLWRAGVIAGELEAVFPELSVGDGIVDLGEIELLDGGIIEGRVLDGLTGEPVSNAWVSATLAADGVIAMPVTGAYTLDGTFRLTGLPPGDYLVFVASNPMEPAEVHIGGDELVEVRLETWSTDTPAELGFSLVTGGAGELVIDAVTDGGRAEELGMVAGDVVSGVRILGVDLSTVHPKAADLALRYYPGPGMSLVVDRDGEAVTIDLE